MEQLFNAVALDMFEVQLGAAILLRFAADTGQVNVLADAGVGTYYPPDHVYQKLLPILGEGAGKRIDLIIGTHYDEDHLKGLVPIISDQSIMIGEAWMPPTVNDTQDFALDQPIRSTDTLAHQFYGKDGDRRLADYLASKRNDCEILLALEGKSDLEDIKESQRRDLKRDRDPLDVAFFRAQLGELRDEHQCDHGAELDTSPDPEVENAIRAFKSSRHPYWPFRSLDNLHHRFTELRNDSPRLGMAQTRSLANVRKSAAKDAINAKSLHEVMRALSKRSIPFRSEVIDDGEPVRFRWDSKAARFIKTHPDFAGFTFTLLGPSRSLVKKHRDRLPILDLAALALMFRGELLSITPSNQLSYIGRFAFAHQGILISGDAGCVDFANGRKTYFPKLLAALSPLHVIQVAHHAGNNAHFYRVLVAAGYPSQTAASLLLLSHAYHDPKRPSPAFADFLLTLKDGGDVKLLFTSEPTRDKVEDYLSAINPLIGSKANVGDVSINFDGGAWKVNRHAIAV
jgi:hypothetical protein